MHRLRSGGRHHADELVNEGRGGAIGYAGWHMVKSPEDLDPDLAPEQLAIIDRHAAEVLSKFADGGRPQVIVQCRSGGELEPHMFDELVRQFIEAGWDVAARDWHVVIRRPPAGARPRGPIRMTKGRPATNIGLLASLIDKSEVEAVFDTYLDDRALRRLVTLRNLGVSFSPKLRLLTSSKGARSMTTSYASDVLQELGCQQGEVRVAAGVSGHEGRLVLLAGGDVVSVGASLNELDVNDRSHRDRDKGDRAAFDERWASATTLP
jgi:hypothetical protein